MKVKKVYILTSNIDKNVLLKQIFYNLEIIEIKGYGCSKSDTNIIG